MLTLDKSEIKRIYIELWWLLPLDAAEKSEMLPAEQFNSVPAGSDSKAHSS